MDRRLVFISFLLPCLGGAQIYVENLNADHPAVGYSGEVNDPATQLLRRLKSATAKLNTTGGPLAYLSSLLTALEINPDSQALVFSKTSIQAAHVSPSNPRAIYFNDNAAVAFIPGAKEIEIAALDPNKGVVFYTIDSTQSSLMRKQSCLRCHQGPATLGVPGLFVGSVFPNAQGQPSRSGSIITDHRTPFADRWGGWYVSAAHGEPDDRANAVASDPADPETLDKHGAVGRFDVDRYLTPFSDIVALMTFEHQTHMTSLLTRINWTARIHPDEPRSADVDELVAYMLFAGEAVLREPVSGVSAFTTSFPRRGPRDRRGRSLRDFDLHTRLFRYPLSYTVYSAAFDAIPIFAREQIYRRLYDILTDRNKSPEFAYLTTKDRRNILEILRDTKADLPSYWIVPNSARTPDPLGRAPSAQSAEP